MELEKALTLPNRENMGFYVAGGAYMLAGMVDALLTIKGFNLEIITDANPMAHFLVDYYTFLVALTTSEIVESHAASNFHKNIVCNLLYSGAALSGIGALVWMSNLVSFSK